MATKYPLLNPQPSLPIGVFDSGMGGLTVLAQMRRELPHENFLYLGDTARLPYGTKSPATVERYALQAAQRLVEHGVKALVVACNTASAFALSHLQQAFAPVPVFGVIEPGADAAAACADDSGILVLATESTIRGGAYQTALASRVPNVPIYGRPCPLWVTLAEQGPQSNELTHTVIADGLRGFSSHGPSTVLLGCTHFPVFAAAVEEILASLGSTDINVVDSAQTTARAVSQALHAQDLVQAESGDGQVHYMATDGAVRFRKVGVHFLAEEVAHVELVDL